MRRREFIPILVAGTRAIAAPQSTGRRRPKIGCVSWNFHSLAAGAHPEEAIDIIGGLGFEAIELIANSRRDVDEYWTDETIGRVRKQLERNHLTLNQFPFFQPVVEGLTSRDLSSDRREPAAHNNLPNVADTNEADAERRCQQNRRLELGQEGTGSPSWAIIELFWRTANVKGCRRYP
jgi:hypothetical protein